MEKVIDEQNTKIWYKTRSTRLIFLFVSSSDIVTDLVLRELKNTILKQIHSTN